MKKILVSVIITSLLAGSCSKSNPIKNEPSYLVLNGKTLTIVPTKADIALEAGTKLGVYVVNVTIGSTETLSSTTIANRLLTVQQGGVISGDAISLNAGNDYDVYAYSPIEQSIPLDPQKIPFIHGTDLLYAGVSKTLRGVSVGKNTVDMVFSHKMSQIKFTLSDNREQSAKDAYPFSNASFEATGFYKDFTLNLETGEIVLGEIDNSVKISQQDTPFCFAPASEDMILPIKISIPGVISGEQTFSGEISCRFIAGYSYSYNIKIFTTSLDIKGSVTDWVTVPSDDVILTQPSKMEAI